MPPAPADGIRLALPRKCGRRAMTVSEFTELIDALWNIAVALCKDLAKVFMNLPVIYVAGAVAAFMAWIWIRGARVERRLRRERAEQQLKRQEREEREREKQARKGQEWEERESEKYRQEVEKYQREVEQFEKQIRKE